jgi:GNAT superfamily N-acetyltransferase
MLTIREARPDDFAAFGSLVREVDALHVGNEPDIFKNPGEPPRPRAYFDRVLASDEKDLFLAEFKGELAGYLMVEVKRVGQEIALLVPQEYAWVCDIVVAEAFRRRGVGHALMAKAREWARSKGHDQIRLAVFDFNVDAMRFYEAEGFGALSHTLIQRL